MKLASYTWAVLVFSCFFTCILGRCEHRSVHSVHTCLTKYGNYQLHDIPRCTKTVYETTSTRVTISRRRKAYYKTGPNKTVTRQATSTYTATKKCPVRTVHTTSHITLTRTISTTEVKTIRVTATITAAATVVPIPSGFLSVFNDPVNQTDGPLKRRNRAQYRYPTAVECTKSVRRACTSTVIIKPHRATVVKPGRTIIVTDRHKATKTVCPNRTVITVKTTSTSTKTTTKRSTRTETKTATATLPGFTTYGVCGPRNYFSVPVDFGTVEPELSPFDPQVPVTIAYDCCAECQKHVNQQGVSDCAGSYFLSDERNGSKCWLRLTNQCRRLQETNVTFRITNGTSRQTQGFVINGICGQWKWQR